MVPFKNINNHDDIVWNSQERIINEENEVDDDEIIIDPSTKQFKINDADKIKTIFFRNRFFKRYSKFESQIVTSGQKYSGLF